MSCENCEKRETCKALCNEVQKVLEPEEDTVRKASWFEFGYETDTLEFLSSVKISVGHSTLLESTEKLTHRENVEYIRQLIETHLSDKQREVLLDYFFRGLNQRQIAERFHISQPTVFFHIQSGILKLKELTKGLL